jgi:anaerobic selenocysteine-containing dehydrogenase
MKRVVHAACPHDCPDACGVLITVQDGRATKIQGDPEHPVTRGFLCAKVAKYLDRVYSPQRVLYPMRRVAAKGPQQSFTPSGQTTISSSDQACAGQPHADQIWQRISWDEALDEIASCFRAIAAEFGSEAILPYSFGGTLGTLNSASMDRRFFHRLGASQLERAICSAAGEAGLESVLGVKLGTEPEQFAHAKYIIAWAANIHANNVHLWPFITAARRNGAKLVVIDPYRTRTAACADWYLPINPGTDAALALGMMHVIIGENLHDADYVAKYTLGFEQLREKVKEYPPERVAQWTGIAADDIRKLAREYATVRPSVIRLNYGVQRSEHGGMATRDRDAALRDWIVEGSRRRITDVYQRRGGSEWRGDEAERSDEDRSGTGSTHHQYGETGPRAEHAQRPAGQGLVRLRIESSGGLPGTQ